MSLTFLARHPSILDCQSIAFSVTVDARHGLQLSPTINRNFRRSATILSPTATSATVSVSDLLEFSYV